MFVITVLPARGWSITRSALLGHAIEAAFARALWLVERISGSGSGSADTRQIGAIVAVRDAHRHARAALDVPAARLWPVVDRRARDTAAPPALRGAALGVLWSTGFFASPHTAATRGPERGHDSGSVRTADHAVDHTVEHTAKRTAERPADHAAGHAADQAAARTADRAVDHATRALKALAAPLLGDFLAGLLALAREELLREPVLIATLDETIAGMSANDFFGALPSLRLAFGYLPPAEKEDLTRMILQRHRPHEAEAADPRDLLRVTEKPLLVARGMALDETISRTLSRYGLIDEEGA